MRAVVLTAYDGPTALELRDVQVPSLAADEVLIAVHAVGANQLDVNTMHGRGPRNPGLLPLVLGVDPAGIVVAQGAGVDGDRIGERVVVKPNVSCAHCTQCASGREGDCPTQTVVGVHLDGGMADYVAVPARNAFPIGDLGFDVACAAVHSLGVAFHALKVAGICAESSVLVTGAAGAVGSAAVQLASHFGARVLALSTTAAPPLAGIDVVVHEGAHDLEAVARELAPGGVNIALDTTGAPDMIAAAIDCTAWLGRTVAISGAPQPLVRVNVRELYLNRRTLIGTASADYADVSTILGLVTEGAASPLIGARFALTEFNGAYAALADRGRLGKVVVRLRDAESQEAVNR